MLNGLKIETENKIANEKLIQIKDGEICEYKLKIEFSQPTHPSVYSIIWEEDQVDMYGFWSSKSFGKHNLTPEWGMCINESEVASGMPLICVYSKANKNRITVALSDPTCPAEIMTGVVEENGCLRFKINLFTKICPEMKKYEVIIRIDRRNIPFYKSVKDSKTWWTELGYKSAHIPREALLPLYSCWYSFHTKTIPEDIIYECKTAKELGMETVIVDAGWYTDSYSDSFAMFCGDWEISKNKIPDMAHFVNEIHKLGMKFMIWFSVPFVGFNSKNYEHFKGRYLCYRPGVKAAVLDPRFPEIRRFLIDTYCNYVKKYNLDGLKLDFIDRFLPGEESSCEYDKMDTVSVDVALQRLLSEATTELKKINPEIMIEFRQSYVGPVLTQYANFLRVADCPNDAIFNRVGSLNLRLTSGDTPVHSDMLMWNKNDTNEGIMYQLLAIMFSVPQISVRFDNITDEHKKLLKAFLSFWRNHQETLLGGELELWGVDANYTVAKSKKDGESVVVLYQAQPITVENGEKAYIFNSTGEEGIFLQVNEDRKFELNNIFGECYESGILHKGIHRVPVQNCGMIFIK
ncbi:MAG: alpha-galactosidase [Clostridia bacterium]|nr:alpha-galactosidase [Clostridia bacterium]